MDMEKTMKMNEIIGELKKHKILGKNVLSRAEKIVLSKDDMPKKESETKKIERRFEYILAENNKKIREELEFLKDNMLKLSKEVSALRNEVKTRPVKQETLEEPQTTNNETLKEEGPHKVKAEIKPGSHPKQGGYSSEDVAVDKVFYFGNK